MDDKPEPFEVSRDSLLYIIDGSMTMAESGALDQALRAVADTIRATAKMGDSQHDAGVIVYNAESTQSKDPSKRSLLALKGPRVDDLKLLIRLASKPEFRSDTLQSKARSTSDFLNALRIAKSEFNMLHIRSFRRIVLITDDDDPTEGSDSSENVAQTLVSDLLEMQVMILPIFIQQKGAARFDLDKFWIKLSYLPSSLPAYVVSAGAIDLPTSSQVSLKPLELESLSSSFEKIVLSKSSRKTSSIRGRLVINNLELGFRGFNVVQQRPRRPTGFSVAYVKQSDGAETREVATSDRIYAEKMSGKTVDGDSIHRAFTIGSATSKDGSVPTSQTDLSELRESSTYDYTRIVVHGFVPSRALPKYGTEGHSVLIVPNSDILANSDKGFASLHRVMRRKNLVAVATLLPAKTRASAAMLGMLYAHDPAPKRFEAQSTVEPNTAVGMYFVAIPFLDDIRTIPPKSEFGNPADEQWGELFKAVTHLVHKFRLPKGFDPGRFPNPRLAQFSYVLEHLALSLEMEMQSKDSKVPLEVPDATKPRYAKIASNAGNISQEIARVLARMEERKVVPTTLAGHRRATPDHGDDLPPSSKRPKNSENLTIDIFKVAADTGKLGKFVVGDLKWAFRELSGAPPPSGAKKADLIVLLQELLAN